MLPEKHIQRMLSKLRRFEETLSPFLFKRLESLPACAFETGERYHEVPDISRFEPISRGYSWGGPKRYCWIRTSYTVPDELDGQDLFLMPVMGGYEAMLFVDGVPFGTFNTKIVYTGHGNHYCDLLRKNARAGETIDIAVEYYAGHPYQGCDPFSTMDLPFRYEYEGLYLCVKRADVQDFYFDLKTVDQLAETLPDYSFFRGRVLNALMKVHEGLYYSPEDVSEEVFLKALENVHPYLKEILSEKNGDGGPKAGLIGHSHMDTAWLWYLEETRKKCARTYSNEISLMEQYPEFKFVQSSAFHSEMIRESYPALFQRIQEKVREGRYEPNGGVWVECDCNITGGESMIRQFLWGQRFTRKYFDYTADCFWLPDTFGYSAAIPQIMKGCGTRYFLTTKISWNDTNVFPYDTFYWEGIDGTRVLSHFNQSHCWPDVKTLRTFMLHSESNDQSLKQPSVSDRRLFSFGFGDGGGGPMYEMIEMARRVQDLREVPKAETMTVSRFMQELEQHLANPNVYRGELYLELHRGTLTNQHEIKYNNRKAEMQLHALEWLEAAGAVRDRVPVSTAESNSLYGKLLVNQFHDLLPGTCIPEAHQQAKAEVSEVIREAGKRISQLLPAGDEGITAFNPLSFDREDTLFVPASFGKIPGAQDYTSIDGLPYQLLSGVKIPAYGSTALPTAAEADGQPFEQAGDRLTTPFYQVTFDQQGFISSLIDRRVNRELVSGLPLGTFLMAEDVPVSWDNWDIDPDIMLKFCPTALLESREVVSAGSSAFILRMKYRLSEKSSLTQDLIFFADSPEIRYDTWMDWQDDHRFLKTRFDVNVREDFARHEIQFGYCKRPTTRNNPLEMAKFEVVNHKYTDLSEPGYGISVLNDCKYGISVDGSQIGLSLHKGGTRPDYTGDHGLHHAVYSLYPHTGGFRAENVIRPAYRLNNPVLFAPGRTLLEPLASVSSPNVIIETIKPCEDEQKAFLLRLYEAEGTGCETELVCPQDVNGLYLTNMLEEEEKKLAGTNRTSLTFRPFEIKTIKATY